MRPISMCFIILAVGLLVCTNAIAQGGMRVYYQAEDGNVHELAYPTSKGIWSDLDLGVQAVSESDIISTLYEGDMRVYYQSEDGNIHEQAYFSSENKWLDRDLGVKSFPGSSHLTSTYYYGDLRVYYQNYSTIEQNSSTPPRISYSYRPSIHELVYSNLEDKWSDLDLGVKPYYYNADNLFEGAVYGSSLTSTHYNGDMRVYYQSEDGNIHEQAYSSSENKWLDWDIKEKAAPGSALTSTLYNGDMRVYYRNVDGDIHELAYFTSEGKWRDRNLGVQAASGSALITTPDNGNMSVYFQGPDGNLGEMRFDGDLCVYYQGVDGNLHELAYLASEDKWSNQDLGVKAILGSALTLTLYSGDVRIYYQSEDGNIHGLAYPRWHPTSEDIWRDLDLGVKAIRESALSSTTLYDY